MNHSILPFYIFAAFLCYCICGFAIWKLWCATFGTKWLYKEYNTDISIWIPLAWPITFLMYIYIMIVAGIMKLFKKDFFKKDEEEPKIICK